MRKRLLLAILCLAMMLSGCRLAKSDGEAEEEKDRLVGVLITATSLLEMDGGIPTEAPGRPGDQNTDGRIYAELVTETYETEDGGDGTRKRYVFPSLEGMMLASYEVHWEGGAPYQSTDTTEGISGVSCHVNISDTGDKVELAGTVYLSKSGQEQIYHINPMYQSEDGKVYVLPGQSYHSGAEGNWSVKLEESWKCSDGETTTTGECNINISFEPVDVPQKVRVCQMNEENEVLSAAEFIPGHLPDSLRMLADTAYILVEIYSDAGVERRLYQETDTGFSVLYPMNETVCVEDWCNLDWQN